MEFLGHHVPQPGEPVESELQACLIRSGARRHLLTILRYDPTDPVAVKCAFFVGKENPVEWVFARDLLGKGLQEPTGEGDVRVRAEGDVLQLDLSSPDGQSTFHFPLDGIKEFIDATYKTVDTTLEINIIDAEIEVEVANILG